MITSRIVYPDGTKGSTLTSTVVKSEGPLLELSTHRAFSDGRKATDPFNRRIALGFLPAGVTGEGERVVSFEPGFEAAIAGLSVGRSVRLPVQERTAYGGRSRRVRDDYEVELTGCGEMLVGTRVEPVRVYRVTVFNRSYRPGNPPQDTVVRNTSTHYVGAETGWSLRELEGIGGEIVVVKVEKRRG
ncbi:MAG TPA: hypothetical protein VD931_14680 [Baekduia sp.]|nr:hypothetical protein [Baekduia sp.]